MTTELDRLLEIKAEMQYRTRLSEWNKLKHVDDSENESIYNALGQELQLLKSQIESKLAFYDIQFRYATGDVKESVNAMIQELSQLRKHKFVLVEKNGEDDSGLAQV